MTADDSSKGPVFLPPGIIPFQLVFLPMVENGARVARKQEAAHYAEPRGSNFTPKPHSTLDVTGSKK
jgi:hypothetical protein